MDAKGTGKEQFFDVALGRVSDLVIVTNADLKSPSGPTILYVNEAVTELTGYRPDELIGQSPKIFQGPQTDPIALGRARSGLVSGAPVREELINYSKDGSPYWIEMRITPVVNSEGETTHFIAIERDITESTKFLKQNQLLKERFELAADATKVVIFD